MICHPAILMPLLSRTSDLFVRCRLLLSPHRCPATCPSPKIFSFCRCARARTKYLPQRFRCPKSVVMVCFHVFTRTFQYHYSLWDGSVTETMLCFWAASFSPVSFYLVNKREPFPYNCSSLNVRCYYERTFIYMTAPHNVQQFHCLQNSTNTTPGPLNQVWEDQFIGVT